MSAMCDFRMNTQYIKDFFYSFFFSHQQTPQPVMVYHWSALGKKPSATAVKTLFFQ